MAPSPTLSSPSHTEDLENQLFVLRLRDEESQDLLRRRDEASQEAINNLRATMRTKEMEASKVAANHAYDLKKAQDAYQDLEEENSTLGTHAADLGAKLARKHATAVEVFDDVDETSHEVIDKLRFQLEIYRNKDWDAYRELEEENSTLRTHAAHLEAKLARNHATADKVSDDVDGPSYEVIGKLQAQLDAYKSEDWETIMALLSPVIQNEDLRRDRQIRKLQEALNSTRKEVIKLDDYITDIEALDATGPEKISAIQAHYAKVIGQRAEQDRQDRARGVATKDSWNEYCMGNAEALKTANKAISAVDIAVAKLMKSWPLDPIGSMKSSPDGLSMMRITGMHIWRILGQDKLCW